MRLPLDVKISCGIMCWILLKKRGLLKIGKGFFVTHSISLRIYEKTNRGVNRLWDL